MLFSKNMMVAAWGKEAKEDSISHKLGSGGQTDLPSII
jgi:hypothetical protein